MKTDFHNNDFVGVLWVQNFVWLILVPYKYEIFVDLEGSQWLTNGKLVL